VCICVVEIAEGILALLFLSPQRPKHRWIHQESDSEREETTNARALLTIITPLTSSCHQSPNITHFPTLPLTDTWYFLPLSTSSPTTNSTFITMYTGTPQEYRHTDHHTDRRASIQSEASVSTNASTSSDASEGQSLSDHDAAFLLLSIMGKWIRLTVPDLRSSQQPLHHSLVRDAVSQGGLLCLGRSRRHR
jgi:hypothetical protein